MLSDSDFPLGKPNWLKGLVDFVDLNNLKELINVLQLAWPIFLN